MNLLSLENITKFYTERKLFDKASFYLNEGEKVGIIGINGTGKSTLLRIIAGLETVDEGSVTKANHVVIHFLSQHPQFEPEQTVLEAVLGRHQDKEDVWSLEAEAKSMLGKLGVTDFEEPCGHLSGGQRKRLALVSAILTPCDILVLDEPTNHLDHEMADWLEEVLKKWRGSLVMVTHDRYFLDSVSNRIVEIDKGQIYSYQTNYSGFLKLKAEREEMELASERKRKSILRTELEWLMRGARARSTKQKAHIQRIEDMQKVKGPQKEEKLALSSASTRLGRSTVELHNICKAYGERKLIDDFTYIFLKQDRIGFVGSNGCGKTTLMKLLTGVIEPDSGEILIGQTVKLGYYAQEIDISGKDSSEQRDAGRDSGGKDLSDQRNTDGGISGKDSSNEISFGKNHAGQGKDQLARMDPNKRVIDYIRDTAEYVKTEDGMVSASQMLERFLFPADQQYSPIGKLSGGERRRLNLLRVLMEAPNVLILDEPTNDLDIQTLTILEDYLDHYAGIVIIVSHDRYFLDRTVRRIFAFEDGRLVQYEGGYTDYINKKKEKEEALGVTVEKKAAKSAGGNNSIGYSNRINANVNDTSSAVDDIDTSGTKKNQRNSEHKLKFSYKEQREFDTIDEDIAKLEAKIEELEQGIIKAATDFVKLGELTKEKEQTEQALEEKMERWVYLNELKEQME